MPTPEEIAAIRAKSPTERTDDEKSILQTVDHPGTDPKKQTNMVPQSRMDELNERMKAAEARAEAAEKLAKEAEEKRLREANDYKTLYEQTQNELNSIKPAAAQVAAMDKTLQDVLAAQIAEMPEDRRGLVPGVLTTQQKLDWIAQNRAVLMAPKAFDIGAGRTGGGEPLRTELSQEQKSWAEKLGMTYEDYAKNY